MVGSAAVKVAKDSEKYYILVTKSQYQSFC